MYCELMLFTYYSHRLPRHALGRKQSCFWFEYFDSHTHGCTVSVHVASPSGLVLKLSYQLGPPPPTGARRGQAVTISPHWTTVTVSPAVMNQTRPLSTALNSSSLLHSCTLHTHTLTTNVCASSPLIRHDVSFHLISSDPCFFLIEAAANTIMVRIIPDWCEDGLTGLRR